MDVDRFSGWTKFNQLSLRLWFIFKLKGRSSSGRFLFCYINMERYAIQHGGRPYKNAYLLFGCRHLVDKRKSKKLTPFFFFSFVCVWNFSLRKRLNRERAFCCCGNQPSEPDFYQFILPYFSDVFIIFPSVYLCNITYILYMYNKNSIDSMWKDGWLFNGDERRRLQMKTIHVSVCSVCVFLFFR